MIHARLAYSISGQAFCPFKLDTTGAHVLQADGTYKKL